MAQTISHTPQIIYILGAGNSGSTLLSMALGAHSRVLSVGELSALDRYLRSDLSCTCGVPLSRCEFWGHVDLGSAYVPLRPLISERSTHMSKRILQHDALFHLTVQRNLDIYHEVSERSGCPVVVDSSKDNIRLYYLALSGRFRLLPIRLVRNGLAYIDSKRRRGRGFITSFRRWSRMNTNAVTTLRRLRLMDSALTVSYDEFASSPGEVLAKICERVGLAFEPQMVDLSGQLFHNIAGTPGRFDAGIISPRDEWRARTGPITRARFGLCGGYRANAHFNKKRP